MPTTNYNPLLARANFMEKVEYKDYYHDAWIEELDPLSPEIHEFISALSQFRNYSYAGEQLTTICNQAHGTTTTVWIVLMVNGLLSRTDLRIGMILKIPTIDNIRQVMNSRNIQRLTKVQAFGSQILT